MKLYSLRCLWVVVLWLLMAGCKEDSLGASSLDKLAWKMMRSVVTSDFQSYMQLHHPKTILFYESKMPGFLESYFYSYDYLIKESSSNFDPSRVTVEYMARDVFTPAEWHEAISVLRKDISVAAYRFSYQKNEKRMRIVVMVAQDKSRFFIILPNYIQDGADMILDESKKL